ncbi:Spo0B domain-containing protein [Virgibacillus sp. W0181]|uniref:Spo0B domain-containing protein n=1 Tax=Virgibacillus sp. W0181 TaxID=3391581 RepID=UPI003F4782E3
MNEKKFMQFLQNYRHDILNELQIVHGYASMGNLEKVENKVSQMIASFHNERKLISLHAPKLALWVIEFNHRHENIRITYDMHTENINLEQIDDSLVYFCDQFVKLLTKYCNSEEYYEGNLELHKRPDEQIIELHLSFQGNMLQIAELKENLIMTDQAYEIVETNSGVRCSIAVSFQ